MNKKFTKIMAMGLAGLFLLNLTANVAASKKIDRFKSLSLGEKIVTVLGGSVVAIVGGTLIVKGAQGAYRYFCKNDEAPDSNKPDSNKSDSNKSDSNRDDSKKLFDLDLFEKLDLKSKAAAMCYACRVVGEQCLVETSVGTPYHPQIVKKLEKNLENRNLAVEAFENFVTDSLKINLTVKYDMLAKSGSLNWNNQWKDGGEIYVRLQQCNQHDLETAYDYCLDIIGLNEKIQKLCSLPLLKPSDPNTGSGNSTSGTDLPPESDRTPLPIISNKNDVIMPKNVSKNVKRCYVISPFSCELAMMMAAVGAKDGSQTQEQILTAYGKNKNNLSEANNKLREDCENLIQNGFAKITNSVWLNKGLAGNGVEFTEKFKKEVSKSFNAEVKCVGDDKIVEEMNNHVSEATDGLIPKIINDSNFIAVLLNAIYFKANWKYQFKKDGTEERLFTDGKNSKMVTSMYQENKFRYKKFEKMEVIELNYGNSPTSMFIVLPKVGHEDITREEIDNAIDEVRAVEKTELGLTLPKFKAECTLELQNDLKKYGIERAFDVANTDFDDNMIQNHKNLYISKVFQKAVIDVGEEGTEAAAATACVCEESCRILPVQFNVNRPFWYTIRYGKTELFSGRQTF
ncbi:hypothetical protein FACS189465_0480 [Clostridia bacterium]|nr:hypothetical protein FACS189465_0480 [Clostridia bacterium]